MKNKILEPEEAIELLMDGGECVRDKQPYTVIYQNGMFIVKESGSLVGNLNGLREKTKKT